MRFHFKQMLFQSNYYWTVKKIASPHHVKYYLYSRFLEQDAAARSAN